MLSTIALSGFGVNRLTTGTITSPADIAIAPQLIGDCIITGKDSLQKILAIINTELKIKQTKQDALVTHFTYREYINGAKKEPARAPQDTPINCAMNVTELLYWIKAKTEDIAINTTIKTRISNTCFFSLMFFTKLSLIKSIVNVELDAITSEDNVDIEADNTKITTKAISTDGSPDNMVGIIESKPFASTSI